LLIDHSGVLKISDFGLSRIRPDPSKKETDTFVMTGETGSLPSIIRHTLMSSRRRFLTLLASDPTGSYRFMAPEVYRRVYYNETVDVYSYAMIFFYLVTGRPPWPTLPGMQAVKKAADEGDRPNIPRDLDVRLQNFMKECWDDNPNVRPSFVDITRFLTAYSQDVFNEREDAIITAPAEVDTDCENCRIL
jgi:serine/threonine protein kinase